MDGSNVLIVLATYNELENLPTLVARLRQQFPAATLQVIDDHSPDGTPEWCRAYSAEDPNFRFVIRTNERGLGSATMVGLRTAIEGDFRWVVTMDADWSHDPEDLPVMLNRMVGPTTPVADVCIGSRYIAGGRIEGWPIRRRVISRVVNVLTRWGLGLSVKDNTGAFRVYRVEALRRLDLGGIRATGYGYLEEILFRLAQTGAVMVESPIVFRDRAAGTSKTDLREGLRVLRAIGRLSWERMRRNVSASRRS